MTRRFIVRGIAICAVATLSGCFTTRVEPPRPLTMTLWSSTPVQLTTTGASGMTGTSPCFSLHAVVTVAQLRGDTLFYDKITPLRDTPHAESCNRSAPGYIDLKAHPTLTVIYVQRSTQRSVLWGLAILALVSSVASLLESSQ
jgi:hypothetical protein